MLRVVVAEDVFLGAGLADARDHRVVVQRVGEDDAAGQQCARVPSVASLEM